MFIGSPWVFYTCSCEKFLHLGMSQLFPPSNKCAALRLGAQDLGLQYSHPSWKKRRFCWAFFGGFRISLRLRIFCESGYPIICCFLVKYSGVHGHVDSRICSFVQVSPKPLNPEPQSPKPRFAYFCDLINAIAAVDSLGVACKSSSHVSYSLNSLRGVA